MSEVTDQLLREGRYLEAVQRYIQEPLQSKADYSRFLLVLQSCLDHVLHTSPSHFPKLLEITLPKFGSDETVMLILGKRCSEEEMYTEAAFFLRKIQADINPDCLLAKESLCTLNEVVVPRWHFLMLNDVTRNSSYSRAIANAVGRIPDCSVLDIGSGTGLLSMLAVRSGAARVYACELNTTMVTMSHDILASNGMADKVAIIHKTSTEATIPADLPERVCLVVTETVDAGLLGEAIVPTLRHAWSELLLPRQPSEGTNPITRCGHVIPCGATVYVMAIECQEIARQSRLLSEAVGGLSFHDIILEGSCTSEDNSYGRGSAGQEAGQVKSGGERRRKKGRLCREPYTCERLSCIRGGYKGLTGSCAALQFDFTDPLIPLPSARFCVPVVMSGHLDAIAMYFDLHLDPTTSISTSPHGNDNSSWDQAIYPVVKERLGRSEGREGEEVWVQRGDILHICATCTDTLLHVSVDRIERAAEETETRDTVEQPVLRSSVHFVDREALSRLNDGPYFSVYTSAISHALDLLRAEKYETESESSPGSGDDSELHCSMAGINLDGGGMESMHDGGGMESMHDGGGMESSDGGIGLGSGTKSPSGEDTAMGSENESESDEEDDFANCIALDMSHELPIIGIMAAKIGVDFVQVGRCHSVYQSLLETVARDNDLQQNTSIKWVELGANSAPQLVWDMVLCDVVSPQGVLRADVFEELGAIRSYQTHSDTAILPAKVTVHSVAISSPILRAQTTVLGSVPTLGLDIARFINKYQISHFIDVDLRSLSHDRLTEKTQLLSVNLCTLSAKPFTLESKVCMKVTSTGTLTGFLYWFILHFPNGETISTGPERAGESHWHQAVFCLLEDVPLQAGQHITVRTLIRDSCLDIALLSTE